MAMAAGKVVGAAALLACTGAWAEQQQVASCSPSQSCGLAARAGADHVLIQRRSSLAALARDAGRQPAADDGEQACHTLLEGEPCYSDVHWAMLYGILDYPQWYPGLSPASNFEDFQAYMHEHRPEACPRPCATTIPAAGEACVSRAVSLDFFHAELSHRNLGGLGPDSGSEDMRYKHVGNSSGMPFDLVVRATSSYTSNMQTRNGLAGKYGVINLKAGTSVDLTFSFVDSYTDAPVVPEAFHFSILDLDEYTKVKERIYIDGFENYTLYHPTDVAVDTAPDGRTVFKSTEKGAGCDNPKDPLQLGEVTCRGRTIDQKSRAVTFLFSNMSSFDLTFDAPCSKNKCNSGRNFLFAGSSSLSYSCEVRTQIQFSVGPWPERFLQRPVGGLLLFRLPGNVEITVTGVDWMSVVITMPQQQGGQGGYCGDFDGVAHDDFETRGLSFHKPIGPNLEAVEASQSLFGKDWMGSPAPQDANVSQLDPDSVVRDCSPMLKEMANQRCKMVMDARLRDDCIFDVCATGLVSAAEGILAAEILEEKVNARGIPLFRGQGQCKDSAGELYTAFNTSLAMVEDCKDVLRSLATTGAVVGAQIHRDTACQILVQNNTDPTHVSIRGGWGPRADGSGQGVGMVSNTSGDESWDCWQLV